MDPAEALADLRQISTQVQRAAIIGADGALEASTLADPAAAEHLAAGGRTLWEGAERARKALDRPPLTQFEVATPEGSVFVVADDHRIVVAVTSVDPTVGLVFYDLKSCLRVLLEEPIGTGGPADDEEAVDGTA
jgi:predicted regulator of Ras-like GTPase activity (Roadblock/LC7/MglB family)